MLANFGLRLLTLLNVSKLIGELGRGGFRILNLWVPNKIYLYAAIIGQKMSTETLSIYI